MLIVNWYILGFRVLALMPDLPQSLSNDENCLSFHEVLIDTKVVSKN